MPSLILVRGPFSASFPGVKYLIATALLVALFIWFTHRSATPRAAGSGNAPATTPAAVAQQGTLPAPSRTPSALRRPIVRTQDVLQKVKEFQKEGD